MDAETLLTIVSLAFVAVVLAFLRLQARLRGDLAFFQEGYITQARKLAEVLAEKALADSVRHAKEAGRLRAEAVMLAKAGKAGAVRKAK